MKFFSKSQKLKTFDRCNSGGVSILTEVQSKKEERK